MNKTHLNRYLKKVGVEVHGSGYIKKLQKAGSKKDPFITKQKVLSNVKMIFDIGSNNGAVSKKYSQLFPSAEIHAFEPFEAFNQSYREENQGSKFILNNIALSNTIGVSDFYLNSSSDTNSLLESIEIGASSDKSCSNVGKTKVATDTIESYCGKNQIESIDILKIDTQGSELSILMGAEQFLSEKRIKLIYMETYFKPQYRKQPLFYEIGAFLQRHGYFLEDIYDPFYNDSHLLWCDAIFVAEQ